MTVLIVLGSTLAAGAPACSWSGGVDPYTGADARHIEVRMALGALRLTIGPASGGWVPVRYVVRDAGVTHAPLVEPLQLLGQGGHVASIEVVAPAPPVADVSGSTVITTHAGNARVDEEVIRRIVASGGITSIRVPLPSGAIDRRLSDANSDELLRGLRCAIDGS